ncbi:hypothetical protein PF008_g32352, partial [Phytophthora fragariae]
MVQARTGGNGCRLLDLSIKGRLLLTKLAVTVLQAWQAWGVGLMSLAIGYASLHAYSQFRCVARTQPPCHHCNLSEVMQVRERFATKGYVIFYGAVHVDTINSWRSIARQIDGWFEEEVNDGFFGFFDDEANMTEERVRVKVVVPDQDAR